MVGTGKRRVKTGRKEGGNWEKRRWELREKEVGTGKKGWELRRRGGNLEKRSGNWEKKGWELGKKEVGTRIGLGTGGKDVETGEKRWWELAKIGVGTGGNGGRNCEKRSGNLGQN